MKREVRTTADGSKTLYIESLDEHYHSFHGAVQESLHVFIKNGLEDQNPNKPVKILEIGFGTGLNAILTLAHTPRESVFYQSLEAYPLTEEEWKATQYEKLEVIADFESLYYKMHLAPWNQKIELSPNFTLEKSETTLQDFSPNTTFDLIYYDAFAPSAQPELWTEEVFQKMYSCLSPGGKLVTYCAKGYVKRNMKSVGFLVEALPGPPGKREMTRATKPIENE